ncbi:MAG TPA: YihY/virulence factor BrkB family protein [Anaerolineales bacterium]|jgi:membrane protein|nr:YihY/virulence factor BrkB family protein [Anaerolineales bacterium]
MKKFFANVANLLKLAVQGWTADNASRLAAALAYYTIFSIAPLLIIVIAITGLIWDAGAVRVQILSQVQSLVGAEGAEFVAGLMTNTGSPGEGILALVIGILTLLFGALGVFNELHNSLNIIWNVRVEKPKGFLQSIKKIVLDRLLSFTMILGIGFLLLVSLVVTAGLSATQETFGEAFPIPEFVLQILNLVISLGVITVLFALIFKFLPDARIGWRDVWMGALVTSLLFSLGKTVIGLYLGNSAVGSTFGAAGSLVLLLLWIYYSAQILFFGAEFTQVYANQYGSKMLSGGEEALLLPDAKESGAIPPASTPLAVSARAEQLEKQNRQTARIFAGLMAASFLAGMLTRFFGPRKSS